MNIFVPKIASDMARARKALLDKLGQDRYNVFAVPFRRWIVSQMIFHKRSATEAALGIRDFLRQKKRANVVWVGLCYAAALDVAEQNLMEKEEARRREMQSEVDAQADQIAMQEEILKLTEPKESDLS